MKLVALGRVQVKSRVDWREWLHQNHITSPGIWLVTYKKQSGKPRLEYAEVVEELLCFGWVDSKPAKLDAERSMLLCTPRKPKSAWSAINKARVEKLIAEGKMAPRGLELVALAKKTGRWDALNEVDALKVPPDLARALVAAGKNARAHWDAFPRSVRRGILEWILNAKKPETRAKRIEETARLAEQNLRANQWPR